jgi:hypothetical protein
MKPFILIISTAALALASPIIPTMAIIPTMVPDPPSVSTSTSAPTPTSTDDPDPSYFGPSWGPSTNANPYANCQSILPVKGHSRDKDFQVIGHRLVSTEETGTAGAK